MSPVTGTGAEYVGSLAWPERPEGIGRLAEIAYEQMAPVHKDDAERGYPLLIFLNAYYMPLQTIDDIVRDREGMPGWGILFDPDLCPFRYLPWLAMIAGVRLRPGMPELEMRDRIKQRDGRHRCTPDALIKAARDNLTSLGDSTPRVILRERFNAADPTGDDPGYFQVVTYASQTPDPEAVLQALLPQKDVGLIMTYTVLEGQDYQTLADTHATYTAVSTDYDDYDAMRTDS